jgi:preprotein translocase subunit YajC
MLSTFLALLLLQGNGGGGTLFLIQIVALVVIFYFLLIRPQQKKQKQARLEREKMLGALKAGDKVVTNSGILGTIIAVRENIIQLRVAQSVSIEVLKSSISGPQEDMQEAESSK